MISLTLTCGGDSTANIIAFAMSSAFRVSMVCPYFKKDSNAFYIIVFVSSVATIPGSMVVTLILFLVLSS